MMDIFSKRKSRLEQAGKPDVYQYESLPEPFRVQVTHIWLDAIGPYSAGRFGLSEEPASNTAWKLIEKILSREKGMFSLTKHGTAMEQCMDYIMQADTDGALDIIELSFLVIDRVVREWAPWQMDTTNIAQSPDDAIEELNRRFREHGIG